MDTLKTQTIRRIEEKLEALGDDPLRQKILTAAKNFKTSWIELGQALYSAWKDKLYRAWGYNNFDNYASKEIGIRKQTAMKLLRSYYFLEKEEPGYLHREYNASAETKNVPTYESINVLRLAKNKKELDEEDYTKLKKDIFQEGKDAGQVRKELTALIRQRQELQPQQAWEQKRMATVKRFLSVLKSLREEIKMTKVVSKSIINQADALINKLELEIR